MNTTPTKKYRRRVTDERVEVAARAMHAADTHALIENFERANAHAEYTKYARAALEADAEVIEGVFTACKMQQPMYGGLIDIMHLKQGNRERWWELEQFNAEWEELPL